MYQDDFENCSEIAQSKSMTHTQAFEVGNQISKTKAVITGTSIQVSLKGKIDAVLGGIEVGTQLTFNTSTTITDSTQVSLRQSKTDAVTVPIIVPPYSTVHATHAFIQYLTPIGYSGTVVLDGPIITNQDGITMLSQVFPDEKDRTFDFGGEIENADLIISRGKVSEKKNCPPVKAESKKDKRLQGKS
jgi:hypothetical protein